MMGDPLSSGSPDRGIRLPPPRALPRLREAGWDY